MLFVSPASGAFTAQMYGYMNSKLNRASLTAVAATFLTAVFSAGGSGAIAQVSDPVVVKREPAPTMISRPVVQPLPNMPDEDDQADAPVADDVPGDIDSLAELVAAQPQDTLSREQNCLAGAIYFEAKSESLEGQLAVGRVIVARSKSGRFPGSYCGVVFQPSQFSFVRGNSMPGINKSSRQWRNASALARIADAGTWRSPVEGALFFHASHVSPGWRLKRMARVDNHVFYR